MKFFSFWRSLASFRVRIALNLKTSLLTRYRHDANAHREAEYAASTRRWRCRRWSRTTAPRVPVARDPRIFDEKYPAPPLPSDPAGRAARALALMVACEGHPLLTPRAALSRPRTQLRDTQQAWRRHWTIETLAALEGHLPATRRRAASPWRQPTLADICMVGHVTVAVMQQIDLATWPTVKRIFETAMALPEFAGAHPLAQPDTPEAMRVK